MAMRSKGVALHFEPLSFLAWLAIFGVLLLAMALSSAYIRRLPISTAVVYLALGVAIGPIGLRWIDMDLERVEPIVEHLTEIAVILSLFLGGLKLRLPLRHRAWKAAWILAGPVMLVSIATIAAFCHVVFSMSLPASMLLGAVLAPTDPVLASSIAVTDSRDRDRMRYALSGEAGFNDGMAFPFVFLALEWEQHDGPGVWLGTWALHHLVWAVPSGLLLGYVMGKFVGRLAIRLRHVHRDTTAPSDFLALAIVALTYVLAESIGALGFLAVFAAGVGLRHAETRVVTDSPHPDAKDEFHPPAEHLVSAHVGEDALQHPAVAAGVLVSEVVTFGDTAERILEFVIVIVIGVLLGDYFDPRGLLLAGALFFLVRPLASLGLLRTTATTPEQRWLLGWFGVRGIGSLFYLCFAISHGALPNTMVEVARLTMTTVAASVVLHGISASPLLGLYERFLQGRKAAKREAREREGESMKKAGSRERRSGGPLPPLPGPSSG